MKQVKSLTVKQVSAITKQGLTCLGGVKGLYLMIKGEGRYYVFRFCRQSQANVLFFRLC